LKGRHPAIEDTKARCIASKKNQTTTPEQVEKIKTQLATGSNLDQDLRPGS